MSEVAPGERSGRRRVEIVHESLLREWPRLERWRTQDAEGAQFRDELRRAAQVWDRHDRSPDYLWTDTAFRDYQHWREHYPGGLTPLEEEFAEATVAKARRRRRRLQGGIVAVVVLALGIAAVTGFFWRRSEREAVRAEASKLLALAELRREEDPTEALSYATTSLELSDSEAARVFVLLLLWEAPPALELVPEVPYITQSFSPDGTHLATAGYVDEVRVWPADGGPPIALPGHEDNQVETTAHWASDELIVSRTRHGDLWSGRIWSFPGGGLIRQLDLRAPTWSQVGAGTLLTETGEETAGHQMVRLRAWMLPHGETRELGRVDHRSALGASRSVFVPDGTGWLYARGPAIYVRRLPVQEGRPDRLVGRHNAEVTWLGPLRSSPPQVYSADATGAVQVWDFSEEEPQLLSAIAGLDRESETRRPDPSLRWAVTTSSFLQGEARLWNLESWPQARPLELRRSGSWDSARHDFSPSGDWLVVSTQTLRHLTFWPLHGSFPTVVDADTRMLRDKYRPLAFSPDGRWLATVWDAESIRLWPLPGSKSHEVKALGLPDGTVWTELVFDPKGQFVFVAGHLDLGYAVPLDGSPPRRLERLSRDALLVGAGVSPSGRRVAAGHVPGSGRSFRVWDLETGELRVFDIPKGSAGRRGILDLAFAGESTVYTAGWDGVRRWDLASGIDEVVVPAQPGTAMAMAFAPRAKAALVAKTPLLADGGVSVTSGWSVELLDLARGEARDLPALAAPAGGMSWLKKPFAIDPSATVAAVGDAEGVIRVGRASGGEPHLLVGHEGGVSYLAISPDLKWIASTGDDDTLRLWPMPDLDKAPLHALPRAELVAKLRSLTNIRVVRDAESPEGWKVKIDPFPGWAKVPEW